MLLLSLLACTGSDKDAPPGDAEDSAETDTDTGDADTDTGSADSDTAEVLSDWVDLRLPGGYYALPLGGGRVAVVNYSKGGGGGPFNGRTWILEDPRDGETEAEAVATSRLQLGDTVGDIDGDGVAEWLGGDDDVLCVMPGEATGELSYESALMTLDDSSATGSPDLSGDGLPDVVSSFGEMQLWSGAAGVPHAEPFATVSSAISTTDGAAGPGDIDGDGLADLVFGACCQDALDLRFFAGPLAGAYAADDATDLEDAEGAWFGLGISAAGDLDGDGLDDVAVAAEKADYEGSVVMVYTRGGLTAVVDTPGVALTGRAAGDLNGDGFSDLGLTGFGYYDDPLNSWVLWGPVAGRAELVDVAGQLEDGVGTVIVGDVDDDGADDVLVGMLNAERGQQVLVGLGPL